MIWRTNIVYVMLMTLVILTVWVVSGGLFMGMEGYLEPVNTNVANDDPAAAFKAILGLLPLALVCIALALFAMRLRHKLGEPGAPVGMNTQQLPLKFGIISLAYVVIYFLAGYYIAWRVPELRQYYSGSFEKLPF